MEVNLRPHLARPLFLLALSIGAVATAGIARAQETVRPRVMQVERPLAFDANGRVLVLTPSLAARWKLSAPVWPLGSDWKEARLYASDSSAIAAGQALAGSAVLVAQRVDGAIARYALTPDDLRLLRVAVDAAVVALGVSDDADRATTGFEMSQPAGNVFVRNQTVLGLLAYGPATAAILSNNGAAAAGGYFLAAGSAFFVAANMIRSRSVTRAQTILAFHGGTRGGTAGAVVAAIAGASGGAGYGVPILAGALGGTIAGFRSARGMSDGEAAASGFGADLAAASAIGVSAALGAFDPDTSYHGRQEQPKTKVALGAAVAAAGVGYIVGPRYARRSAYNVTAGDIDVAFTSAALGALAANSFVGSSAKRSTVGLLSTGGLIAGAFLADHGKVRTADRTSADGTLVQLGAVAGMLMGGGLVLMMDAEKQAGVALVAAGGFAGLATADYFVKPAKDAGPRRGVLRSSDASSRDRDGLSRVSLSIVPAATQLLLHSRERTARVPITATSSVRNVPVLRVSF